MKRLLRGECAHRPSMREARAVVRSWGIARPCCACLARPPVSGTGHAPRTTLAISARVHYESGVLEGRKRFHQWRDVGHLDAFRAVHVDEERAASGISSSSLDSWICSDGRESGFFRARAGVDDGGWGEKDLARMRGRGTGAVQGARLVAEPCGWSN